MRCSISNSVRWEKLLSIIMNFQVVPERIVLLKKNCSTVYLSLKQEDASTQYQYKSLPLGIQRNIVKSYSFSSVTTYTGPAQDQSALLGVKVSFFFDEWCFCGLWIHLITRLSTLGLIRNILFRQIGCIWYDIVGLQEVWKTHILKPSFSCHHSIKIFWPPKWYPENGRKVCVSLGETA